MLTLSESDLMYLLTLLRSNDQPMTTSDLVHALQERARK
jgi:predicted transcriptional regulator